MRASPTRFLLCIDDGGYPESLEPRKFYKVLPDANAAKAKYVRVIDESGESYLYPRKLFAVVQLTTPTRKALLAAS